jgi:hypothetical protein
VEKSRFFLGDFARSADRHFLFCLAPAEPKCEAHICSACVLIEIKYE